MPKHIVKQGEHLVGIATSYHFLNYKKIWEDSNNTELKKSRKNPNILFPGDQIYLPEYITNTIDITTEQRHRFIVKKVPLSINIVIKNEDNAPISNTECSITIEEKKFSHITDIEGKIIQPISHKITKGTLAIFDTQYDLLIGSLDPITEVSGQKERLINLGYYPDNNDKESDQSFLSAVEEFQCDNNLFVDGICGPKTQAKIVKIYGC
ncbi:peptidoglycan-binding protein [Desulfosarcina ovata]|uniref:Peptidoglycan binding-like domain-containing protein n=2 Tax=Desulfosarcina ovata TaxID=83564 RepID=A0A5K8A8G5_9BACT|nr:peptidoglycan-binding protein [Desulfosarcina ovata]BBO81500.1 hypothetical protein DSCO28_20660 [Desulfosarcina ovata subsp. sediminis]BBO88759.1 hypothetical protein DSCOOX_19390 [Desulfosarcina ovata subsp. ovata]